MVFWVSAFLDAAAADHERDVAFWGAVTGYGLSRARGAEGEFATLVPPVGDDFLRVQRVPGPSRVHLDLHVASPQVAAADAVELGASVLARPGHVIMVSPGGFTFCFVTHPASVRPEPTRWGDHRSLVDQVCLDIASSGFDAECRFWAELLGWPPRDFTSRPEFRSLHLPPGMPIRLLFQRRDDHDGPVRAHLDLATDDRGAEVARHVSLGATVVRRTQWWTTLRDPAGLDYCVTDRDPETGMLG